MRRASNPARAIRVTILPIASLAAVKAKDKPRGRFGLLAACVAIAATLGAIIGSVGAAGLQRYIPLAIAPDPRRLRRTTSPISAG